MQRHSRSNRICLARFLNKGEVMTVTSGLSLIQDQFGPLATENYQCGPQSRRVNYIFGSLLSVLLVLAIVVFVTPTADAQVYGGSLTGVAYDTSGAVVPGAKVVLVDAEKGFRYTATTDAEGRYILRNLPPGK